MSASKIFYVRFTSVPTFYVRQPKEKTGFDQKIGASFFLCVPSQNGLCKGFRGLFIGLFDDVSVEIRRGGGPSVSQAFGDGNDIRPVVDQHCGDRVPESVGVDVRQAMPL